MLKYIRIKPVFRVMSNLFFTEYKGATLGGMFKTALRRTCCTQSYAIGSHTAEILRDIHWCIGFFGMDVKNWMDDLLREGWVPSERMNRPC